ncbi:hypothetical protein Memar_1737 [Methanoculleus marisnigri JR1]|uniref:Uncharacterized protein n=1 Tax=Methanoculleus marisnigri (strain ATCC 35101 / DSM 1498 / JR1) TaxID=368407 RepID=A3CWB4_METMJ|nr:hypothetical protein Memar_1737 [Methanoculleus marisnigri JR1]
MKMRKNLHGVDAINYYDLFTRRSIPFFCRCCRRNNHVATWKLMD